MNKCTSAQWRNWSGYQQASPILMAAPQDRRQLSKWIKTVARPIRCVGAGHSFTPLVVTQGSIIDLAAFSGLIAYDSKECTATIGAATRLDALMPQLNDIDQALPNMGDIDQQTIAGALATATHGTGSELGAYHSQLTELSLIDGQGNERHLQAGRDDELIRATGVSLCAFGAVTSVTLKNVPSYRLHKRRRCVALTELFDQFTHLMTQHRSAEFFIIPFSSYALYLTSDVADQALSTRPLEEDEDGLATLKLLRDWIGWCPWLRRKLIDSAMIKLPEQDYVQDWLYAYTTQRASRFNEMEYHLPFAEGAKALQEILHLAQAHFPNVYFPIEVRTVAADEFWLSPFYQRATCSIAIHHRAGENPQLFFQAAEKIFRRYHGRPHWGKMHSLQAQELAGLYPRFNDAMEVRRSFDPEGTFLSPYLRQLME